MLCRAEKIKSDMTSGGGELEIGRGGGTEINEIVANRLLAYREGVIHNLTLLASSVSFGLVLSDAPPSLINRAGTPRGNRD